jgi:hypothetical protein
MALRRVPASLFGVRMPARPVMAALIGLLVLSQRLSLPRLGAHNNPSLADAFGFIGLLGSWAALLALGRALTWGRMRRLCWVYPPGGRRPADTHDITGGPASAEPSSPPGQGRRASQPGKPSS